MGQGAEEDPPNHAQHIPGRPDDPGHRNQGVQRVHPKGPQQNQEFPHEPVQTRQADGGEDYEEERSTKKRDHPKESSIIGYHPGVAPLIDHTDHEEEGPGGEAVVDHLEYRSGDPFTIQSKDPQNDKAQVAHAGISHKALQVGLHHRHPRPVDDPHEGEPRDPGKEGHGGVGEQGQGKAEKPVGPHFQEHPSQEDARRRRGFHMGVREPGMKGKERDLNGEGQRKGEKEPPLDRRGDLRMHQNCEVKGDLPSGLGVKQAYGDDRHQHQKATRHRVEDKLDGGIDASRPAPDPDEEVHGKQRGLPKDIEQN